MSFSFDEICKSSGANSSQNHTNGSVKSKPSREAFDESGIAEEELDSTMGMAVKALRRRGR